MYTKIIFMCYKVHAFFKGSQTKTINTCMNICSYIYGKSLKCKRGNININQEKAEKGNRKLKKMEGKEETKK